MLRLVFWANISTKSARLFKSTEDLVNQMFHVNCLKSCSNMFLDNLDIWIVPSSLGYSSKDQVD